MAGTYAVHRMTEAQLWKAVGSQLQHLRLGDEGVYVPRAERLRIYSTLLELTTELRLRGTQWQLLQDREGA